MSARSYGYPSPRREGTQLHLLGAGMCFSCKEDVFIHSSQHFVYQYDDKSMDACVSHLCPGLNPVSRPPHPHTPTRPHAPCMTSVLTVSDSPFGLLGHTPHCLLPLPAQQLDFLQRPSPNLCRRDQTPPMQRPQPEAQRRPSSPSLLNHCYLGAGETSALCTAAHDLSFGKYNVSKWESQDCRHLLVR